MRFRGETDNVGIDLGSLTADFAVRMKSMSNR
jgi:hypothetical protein